KSVCGIVAFAIVVSHTTTRFEAPRPETYALTELYLVLAFIANMRSGGMGSPARTVTLSIACARSGCAGASGVNSKKSGSTASGVTKRRKTRTGGGASQNQSHQRRGLWRRIA